MQIMKFGGSSVGSAEAIRSTVAAIVTAKDNGVQPVVVVSAAQGVTDVLIRIAHLAASGNSTYQEELKELTERHLLFAKELLQRSRCKEEQENLLSLSKELESLVYGVFLVREISHRSLDLIMSFGERASAALVCSALENAGRSAALIDARTIIVTDDSFGRARINFQLTSEKVTECLSSLGDKIPVVTGFIAATEKGQTTTLGRGGSDYTAAVLGALLKAEAIEIWTDVNGVMTADPRKVKKSLSLSELTYAEAMELSHFGAKVIYAPTIQPALDNEIPIIVRNTFNPDFPGTVVKQEIKPRSFPIAGISSIPDVCLLRLDGSGLVGIAGVSSRLFGTLAREKISIILISQASSEHSICLAIEPGSAERAKRSVENEFALEIQSRAIEEVIIEPRHSIIAVVGENMPHTPGISGRLFGALGKNGINVVAIAQGSSELNISVVISAADEAKALNALHDAFFISDTKTISIYLVGTGAVGSTLIEQIRSQLPILRSRNRIEPVLVGLANSRKMFLSADGIDAAQWRETLNSSGEKTDLGLFIETMIAHNLPNSIFVDCTASDDVAACYRRILRAAISIVTPNKRANSGSYESYRELRNAFQQSNVKFFYETNVGAGLPVIGTLNDLLTSGDEIIKIEAVLSGTLSYIFNSYRPGARFSEIVKQAKEKGFTEPDPRDDLSGRDVARKLLILAREMNIALEESDVAVESLVPPDCSNAESVEEFFVRLKAADDLFGKRLGAAAQRGETLCYIAQISQGRASVALVGVGPQHPFFGLSGSDNIISFTTKRYFERPLVVKGPGAGTDVTAAGVFADIVRAASYLT